MIFFDASALAKAYLDEAGTTNVEGVFERMAGLLFVSEFVALEVFTTLRGAFRTTPAARYNEAVERFKQDYAVRFVPVDVDAPVRQSAVELTLRHRQARARSMDVLHLATALQLQDSPRSRGFVVTMITSDRDLAALAEECGLRTFDPSVEPLAALPRAPRR